MVVVHFEVWGFFSENDQVCVVFFSCVILTALANAELVPFVSPASQAVGDSLHSKANQQDPEE